MASWTVHQMNKLYMLTTVPNVPVLRKFFIGMVSASFSQFVQNQKVTHKCLQKTGQNKENVRNKEQQEGKHNLKLVKQAEHWWLKPIIPTILQAEITRTEVPGQPGVKARYSLKNCQHKKALWNDSCGHEV